MVDQTVYLADIAAAAGCGASDIAFLSGLEESTISRLWVDPSWLDRISGKSLQALIPVVPEIAACLLERSFRERWRRLESSVAEAGLELRRPAVLAASTAGVRQHHLVRALEAGAHLVRGDATVAAKHLARFWGRSQDKALMLLFDRSDARLLRCPKRLYEGAAEVCSRLSARPNSFHAFMGSATILHHTARSGGSAAPGRSAWGPRQAAFLRRSEVVGRLIWSNDMDLAERFSGEIRRTPLQRRIEAAALPSYAGDMRLSPDFVVPRGIRLQRTAEEVIEEISRYNDAYTYYLVSAFAHVALTQDPSFGGQRCRLIETLRFRRDRADKKSLAKVIDDLLAVL